MYVMKWLLFLLIETLNFTQWVFKTRTHFLSFSASCVFYSRSGDVRRLFWSSGNRCPAEPAVLLAQGHGGDQEPHCGTTLVIFTLKIQHKEKFQDGYCVRFSP